MAIASKKLSLKSLGLTKDVILETVMNDKSKPQPIAVFYGQMSKFKEGSFTDPQGEVREYKGLRGMFKGQNVVTGDKGAAAICYLPDVALDLIEGQYEDGDKIEFAVQIYAQYDKDAATAYTFGAEFLTEVASEPLNALEMLIADKVPALAMLENKTAKKEKAA